MILSFRFRAHRCLLVKFSLVLLLSGGLCAPAHGASTPPPSENTPRLDSAKVRKLYLDGEFEAAIAILETGLNEQRPFNRNDSVFIYKHLGVMYAARYETREKGKFYMHQLLMTEPTAKILDMYASDMIYMIFKNIQDEFASNRVRLDRAEELVRGNGQDEPAASASKPTPTTLQPAHANRTAWIWVGASAAAVGAGIGLYFLIADNHTPDQSSF